MKFYQINDLHFHYCVRLFSVNKIFSALFLTHLDNLAVSSHTKKNTHTLVRRREHKNKTPCSPPRFIFYFRESLRFIVFNFVPFPNQIINKMTFT